MSQNLDFTSNNYLYSVVSEILCPDYIPDGRIDRSSCTYKVDSKCSFLCDNGFTANRLVSKLHCLSTGNWSQIADETPLCLGELNLKTELANSVRRLILSRRNLSFAFLCFGAGIFHCHTFCTCTIII